MQYTIRRIPDSVDRALREAAARRGLSLNEAAIDALARGLGVEEQMHDDLDDLIGTWKDDPSFDEAIADQDRIDPDLWQ